MWKKIVEWFQKTFGEDDYKPPAIISKPLPVPTVIPEPVVIRPDAHQGWANLIEKLSDHAGIPTMMKIAMLAQWIIESGRGTSRLAKDHCNYGGMKFRPELEGLAVPVSYGASDGMDTYAKFESDLAFIEGYMRFINRGIYAGWQQHVSTPGDYIKFVKSRGYAEDPNYVAKVSTLFKEAEGYINTSSVKVDEEVLIPAQDLTPFKHDDHVYEDPKIAVVDISTILPHGRYLTPSGRARGVVQHYTAGHVAKKAEDVITMLRNLGNREGRLGCFGMDEQGVIYVPRSLGWTQKGYHAGASEWRGVAGMNGHLFGIEVCNPGKLVAAGGEWYAYFDVVNGKPRVGAKPIPKERCRTWVSSYGKQSKGTYMAFTEAQEKALINFSLWQMRVNPEYNLDWVVGHDEISKSGKVDPGACLSMPMVEFRALLKVLHAKFNKG